MKQGGQLQAQVRYWFHSYDVFQTIPKEMAEATPGGIAMTAVACFTCISLFLCELSAFLTATPQTHIVIDSNQDQLLRINFDVHMLDLACEHVTVGVWDAFGIDRQNITRNVQKQRIDHKGKNKGHIYTEDELVELEFSGKSYTPEELSELDADWSSSSDQFKHDDFQSVVEAHDFTMVNFYADWCGHCQQFSPTWAKFDKKANSEDSSFLDADGTKANVRVLKINCVDFEETCQSQRVGSFPTIRFYRRGAKIGEHVEYEGPRNVDGLTSFVKGEVAKRHLHSGATYHDIFTEGCRVSGFVEVARVPGTVHFEAVHPKDKHLNLAFTNVSHHVHHFSFGEAPRRSIASLPQEYKNHVNPIDGKTFVADRFHMAPHHYIKVVHTRFESIRDIRSYQQTHQWSVRTVERKIVPQAKFSFDLAPVEVIITKGERRWYDFVTSLFAIIGGTYSSIALAHGVVKLSLSPFLSLLK